MSDPSGTVEVRPSGIVLTLRPEETLMSAALRAGYRWPTVCGGEGTCRTCFVLVEDGAQHCSPVSDFEEEGLRAIRRTAAGDVRLACQLRVSGCVAVHKRGVKRLPDKALSTPSTDQELP